MTGDTEQQAPGLDWDAASRKMIEQAQQRGTPETDALYATQGWTKVLGGTAELFALARDLERRLREAERKLPYCVACRETHMLHCSDPEHCGGMQELTLVQALNHQLALAQRQLAAAELASSQHSYKLLAVERDELRQWQRELYLAGGNPWFWQGDGEDHLESLTCPILIMPEQLRALLADQAEKQAEEIERLKHDLENKSYEPTHNSTAEIAALKQRLEQSEKALEFAEYLAKAADRYQSVFNADDNADATADAWSALSGAIYEFRKRAALAAAPPGGQQEQGK